MLFSYNDLKTFLPVSIKGIVKDKSTGARLNGVRVFIEGGDKEDFTDEVGAFLIRARNTKGIFIVEKEGYRNLSISFSDDVYFIIQLERKPIETHSKL